MGCQFRYYGHNRSWNCIGILLDIYSSLYHVAHKTPMCHPNGCFLRQGDVRPIWWTKGSHPRPIQHGWTFYGARFQPPHAFFNRVKMVLNNVVLINLLIRSIFISSSLALFCLFPGCCFNSDAALPTGNYTSANHPSRGQEGKLIDTVCFPYRWTYRFPHKTTNIVLIFFSCYRKW